MAIYFSNYPLINVVDLIYYFKHKFKSCKLAGTDVQELAIHRRVSRLNYSRRCAEASAVQAHMKQGIPLAPGMEIGYVIRDARKWEVDPEMKASKFDATYYRGLLKKAWGEAAFVFSLNSN